MNNRVPAFLRRTFLFPAALGAGMFLSSCDDHHSPNGGTAADGSASAATLPAHAPSVDPDWQVSTVRDKMRDTTSVQAVAIRAMANGNKIYLTGDCDENDIKIGFEYHAKTGDASYLETQGTAQVVHIPYRFDNGEIREVLSRTNYKNTAEVLFSYQAPGANNDNSDDQSPEAFAKGLAQFATEISPGLGPQDLRKFLHAKQVRFELPLGGGSTEVVSVNPQEGSFRSFVSACKINLKRMDDAVAHQAAAERAAADEKAQEQAKALKEQQAQAANAAQAEEQREAPIKEECVAGEGTLRVKSTTYVAPNTFNAPTEYAYQGQIVIPVANASVVAKGDCSIVFVKGNTEVTGNMPLSVLELGDAAGAQN